MTLLAPTSPLPPLIASPLPLPPPAATPPVPPRTVPPVQRVLLRHISWATYQALLADIGDGHARLTYDQGWLEIEMSGPLHEVFKKFAAAMVEKAIDRQRVAFEPYGATTWRRPDLRRGLEADDCYYIQNAPRLAGRIELDLTVDPPPDLAIEVASPLLDKVSVYAGLGVPELWRVRAEWFVRLLPPRRGRGLPTG